MSFVGGRALALVRPLRVRGWSLAGPGSRPARPPMMCDNKRERDQKKKMMRAAGIMHSVASRFAQNATSRIYLAALVTAIAVRLFAGALSPFAIRPVRAAMQQCALVRRQDGSAFATCYARRPVLCPAGSCPRALCHAAMRARGRIPQTCTQYSTAQSRKRSAPTNLQKKPTGYCRPFFDKSLRIYIKRQATPLPQKSNTLEVCDLRR